jgi:hypothetical protein
MPGQSSRAIWKISRMLILPERAPGRNNVDDLRRDLTLLRARYDSGAVSPSTYSVICSLETEIAWIEHRSRA